MKPKEPCKYMLAPPPKTHILTPWQIHVSEHCFPCWCGGVTGIEKIFWLLGRCSCVRALFSMLITILLVLFIIISFSFWKKSCFTESLFVDIEILPCKLLPFEKVRSSKKEGYFALKKVRSSTQRNVFSVCINWTFLSSPFFEEQFILYHS